MSPTSLESHAPSDPEPGFERIRSGHTWEACRVRRFHRIGTEGPQHSVVRLGIRIRGRRSMVRNGARLRGGNTGNTAPEVRFKPFFLMSVFPALIASHGHRPPQKINAEFGGCRPRVQRPAPTHTIVMPARLVFRLVLTVIREDAGGLLPARDPGDRRSRPRGDRRSPRDRDRVPRGRTRARDGRPRRMSAPTPHGRVRGEAECEAPRG